MTVAEYLVSADCGTCGGTGVLTDMRAEFDVDQMAFIGDPIEVPCDDCDGTGENPCAA